MHWQIGRRFHPMFALCTLTVASALLAGCVRPPNATLAEPEQIIAEATLQPTTILTKPAALPTAMPEPTATEIPQVITIETPPPGTLVGSPVVLTGQTDRLPLDGKLKYRFFDANGAEIGAGAFDVEHAAGTPMTFHASLAFNPPATGGPIRAQLYDLDAGGVVIASAAIDLFVEPPQAIMIETPPAGTFVGSPVVITGQLARYPFEGRLGYRVTDTTGRQLGSGTFLVSGTPGHPAPFNGSLTFDAPMDGATLRIELFDQNSDGSVIAARASIELSVAPIQQAIIIETPSPGTVVGSPVVITGQTTRYPFDGKLGYHILAANGTSLATGAFNIVGTPGQPTTFNTSIIFTLPRGGGSLRVDLFDQNAATGVIVASASVDLLYWSP